MLVLASKIIVTIDTIMRMTTLSTPSPVFIIIVLGFLYECSQHQLLSICAESITLYLASPDFGGITAYTFCDWSLGKSGSSK